jgi:hypothetical protein
MLTDSNLDCRLTDNLNMNQGSKFQAFSLKASHILTASVLHPLPVSLTCEQPALSPAQDPLYEDVHQIRNLQLRTVKSGRMFDTSHTARNLAFDAQTIQIRSVGSGDAPPTRTGL